MFRHLGPQEWVNIHATHRTDLADLIDIDNSVPGGGQPTPFELLRSAAHNSEEILRGLRGSDLGARALGSGWALTDIAIPRGTLINTKLLNGCFDLGDSMFEGAYPSSLRPYLVLAQCGISVAELNTHLEVTAPTGIRRALKTAGIGAGQTIAGAISGNTHGSALNFGSTPDFVVGIQLVTGRGKSLWIERASYPVLNDDFVSRLGADRLRDDEVFDSALVSFGAFGMIVALAIETDPIYELEIPPVRRISHDDVKRKLLNLASSVPAEEYHYEFIFNPYSTDQIAVEAPAKRVPFLGISTPRKPVWIVRSEKGFALGDQAPAHFLGLGSVAPQELARFQFERYQEMCILSNTRGTPGQLFTATITYFEGLTESAVGVSVANAPTMMDVSSEIIREMRLPAMSQVRVVGPTSATLGFTFHRPRTVIFEFGLRNDAKFVEFERRLATALEARQVPYTLHWSKNSGISPERLLAMYGADRIARWKAARRRVFEDDAGLMRVFDNAHLLRAGLA